MIDNGWGWTATVALTDHAAFRLPRRHSKPLGRRGAASVDCLKLVFKRNVSRRDDVNRALKSR
jgi:hypothetical protein